jgi:hypothetical protein
MTAKRRLIHVGSAALITVGLGVGVAATLHVQAATVVKVTLPATGAVINACNGEIVTLSGTKHALLHITMDSHGGFRGDLDANFQDVKGVGDQGNTYMAPFHEYLNLNDQVGNATPVTLTFNMISKGSAPNFILHEDDHITVNADGTVTSFHDKFRTECQG